MLCSDRLVGGRAVGKALKWLGIGIVGLVVVAVVAAATVYVATAPEGPPPDSPSARALAAAEYDVAEADLTFVDASRPTPANGSYGGADSRTLVTTLWYPTAEVPGGSPLVIYSHGFMSNRTGGSYLAEALARSGYVVASADFPLSNGDAPGGATPTDVINQPGDVSFLIDSVLGLDGDEKPFPGRVDPARIGVMGLSLGGLTTTLVGYHPRLRDTRVRAVISIAGPAAMFSRRYFLNSQAPFLMIAGTADAVVDYETHAAGLADKVPHGTLLTIRDGSHTAFVGLAEPLMRFMDHPDSIACYALIAGAEGSDDPFAVLGDAADGIDRAKTKLEICGRPLGHAMHPGRQHTITEVGVVAFFTAQFAESADDRRAAGLLLRESLPRDMPEASVSP